MKTHVTLAASDAPEPSFCSESDRESGKQHVSDFVSSNPSSASSASSTSASTHLNSNIYQLTFPIWLEKWPLKTDIWCHWCCHPHDNVPIPLPVQRPSQNKYICQGLFCSFNCAKACAVAQRGEYSNHGISALSSLLRQMLEHFRVPNLEIEPIGWTGLMGSRGGISCAKPRHTLIVFGGRTSITEFRKGFIVAQPIHGKDPNNPTRRWTLNIETMMVNEEEEQKQHESKEEAAEKQELINSMTRLVAISTRQHLYLRGKDDEDGAEGKGENEDGAQEQKGKQPKQQRQRRSRKQEQKDKMNEFFTSSRQQHELMLEAKRKQRVEEASNRIKQLEGMKINKGGLPIRKASSLSSCLNIEISYKESL